jgi:hypothetical protein
LWCLSSFLSGNKARYYVQLQKKWRNVWCVSKNYKAFNVFSVKTACLFYVCLCEHILYSVQVTFSIYVIKNAGNR